MKELMVDSEHVLVLGLYITDSDCGFLLVPFVNVGCFFAIGSSVYFLLL